MRWAVLDGRSLLTRSMLSSISAGLTPAGSLLVGAVFAGLLTSGCWTSQRPAPLVLPEADKPQPLPEKTTPASGALTDTPEPVDVVKDVTEAVDAAAALPSSLVLTDVQGVPAGAFARYVDITPRLEQCQGHAGEEVELMVTFEEGKVVTRVQDTTADDAVAGCVREAVQVDVQELADPSGQRLPDVRSLVTIRFGP